MISVIICSVNELLLNKIKLNIEATIGVVYEIIAVENKSNRGICEVYNTGGKKAQYPFLCFVHEDVFFYTDKWGTAILNHFNEDDMIGLIGVAGGDTKGIVPSGWFTTFKSKEISILQKETNENEEVKRVCISASPDLKSRTNVTSADGVFLCTRKDIFNQFQFDENNLKGFHGYDMDYSLKVLTKFKVVVVFDVLLLHFSEGKLNRDWLESTRQITKKWRKELPVSVYNLSAEELSEFHWKSLQEYLEHLFRLKYSYAEIIACCLKYSFTRYFRLRRFFSMGKYVLHGMYNRSVLKNSDDKVIENEFGELPTQALKKVTINYSK
jgi:Glycosyltransferase like family